MDFECEFVLSFEKVSFEVEWIWWFVMVKVKLAKYGVSYLDECLALFVYSVYLKV